MIGIIRGKIYKNVHVSYYFNDLINVEETEIKIYIYIYMYEQQQFETLYTHVA